MTMIRTLLFALVALVAVPALGLAQPFSQYEKASFDKLVKSGKPVVVHVHADWWLTCKRQVLVLTELLAEPEMKSLAPVVVNYDTDAEFKQTFNTPNRSTILVFRGGREVGRVTGVTDKDALRKLLAAGATS